MNSHKNKNRYTSVESTIFFCVILLIVTMIFAGAISYYTISSRKPPFEFEVEVVDEDVNSKVDTRETHTLTIEGLSRDGMAVLLRNGESTPIRITDSEFISSISEYKMGTTINVRYSYEFGKYKEPILILDSVSIT